VSTEDRARLEAVIADETMPDESGVAWVALADIYEAEGQTDKALEAASQASDAIEKRVSDVRNFDLDAQLLDTTHEVLDLFEELLTKK